MTPDDTPVSEVSGIARLGKRTKHLVKRLKPGDVAVIDHLDLDRVSGEDLVGCGVTAVINCRASSSGSYPNAGPVLLVQAGIHLVDVPDDSLFKILRDGDAVTLRGGEVLRNGEVVATGRHAGPGDRPGAERPAARGHRRGPRGVRAEHRRAHGPGARAPGRPPRSPALHHRVPRPAGSRGGPRRRPPARHQGAAVLHPRRQAGARRRRRRRRRPDRAGVHAGHDRRRHGLRGRAGPPLRRRARGPRLRGRPGARPRAAGPARPSLQDRARRRPPARTSPC